MVVEKMPVPRTGARPLECDIRRALQQGPWSVRYAIVRSSLPHMPLMHLARRPPQWLRIALAGLLLAFAVNSIAHVTHRHDAAPSSAQHTLACGYCLSFNGLADAPRHNHAPLTVAHDAFYIPANIEASFEPRPATSARPRAPPIH